MSTYTTDDSGIIRHDRRLVLFCAGSLLDPQVFHVAATENDIFVGLIGCCDLLCGVGLATFGAVGLDIFEGDCGIGRVDFV